jgi:hypothetical protein
MCDRGLVAMFLARWDDFKWGLWARDARPYRAANSAGSKILNFGFWVNSFSTATR